MKHFPRHLFATNLSEYAHTHMRMRARVYPHSDHRFTVKPTEDYVLLPPLSPG